MALALAALALAAAGAQAVVVTVSGERISLELLPSAASRAHALSPNGAKPHSKKPVTNPEHNPVMPSNTNYAIYWDPSGGAAFPAGYQSGIDTWFEDLAHDSGGLMNTDSVLVQYGANYNSHFGAAYVDTDPYPASGCTVVAKCLDAAQVRAEIASFVEANSLPTDLEHMYFLLTPSGVESCTDEAEKVCSAGTGKGHAAYCAYHNFIELPKGVIVFAYDPYVGGLGCADAANKPNNNPSDEELAGGLAHEHSEGITDPKLNAWHDEHGAEVGDKCRVQNNPEAEFGPALGQVGGSNYNQVIDGHRYWYQQEWSNEAGGCAQRALAAPTITKIKPKNGPEAGGTLVTITGTGFTSGAVVKFDGTASTEVTFESSTSITAVSPKHVAGTVFITVTTEGGTSEAENRKAKFKYKKAKPPKGP
jgi:hypothetical protein